MFREGKVPGPADLAYEPLIDIVQELREAGHIDHMFRIARGGCNDVVNLQLLCSNTDLRKFLDTSVPLIGGGKAG
jgi:hypothetical protein